ncbi:GNAT family N-acetyltransferase [Cellulomonas triticagri]|uniref:GNAT family N-acetyltransferase n=1 Tax=Cellulomonas triticagri TaxID=2483352 RepID=A0A3M2IY61_9CELL|nr:GNAT family N-acetyltransferase [Cellulomonas triticagri]RMI06802.1 GNAT family N-acetyltransferase [Cellulomonas triticagri]
MTTTPLQAAPLDPARLTARDVRLQDPLVGPLLDGLAHEYSTRYTGLLTPAQLRDELEHDGAEEFAAPGGALVLVLEDDEPVAGGAYRRRTEPEHGDPARLADPAARAADGAPAVPTAELKRIWTHAAHRRRGLARVVLAELEQRAAAAGYPRVYLTTGPKQPEAVGLYLAAGYTPLFDPASYPGDAVPHAFEKWLVTP